MSCWIKRLLTYLLIYPSWPSPLPPPSPSLSIIPATAANRAEKVVMTQISLLHGWRTLSRRNGSTPVHSVDHHDDDAAHSGSILIALRQQQASATRRNSRQTNLVLNGRLRSAYRPCMDRPGRRPVRPGVWQLRRPSLRSHIEAEDAVIAVQTPVGRKLTGAADLPVSDHWRLPRLGNVRLVPKFWR